MRRNNTHKKAGPVLWRHLWKLLPAYPADLSLQGEGCCQGRMRVLLRALSRTGSPTVDFVFLASSSGLHETLALLTSQLRPDSNHREEMGFLRDVFSEKSLSYLMKVRACLASFPVPGQGRLFPGSLQPFPCPVKVLNSLGMASRIHCYGEDPVCGPRCHPNPGCGVYLCRFTRNSAIMRGRARPLSCTVPWPSRRM